MKLSTVRKGTIGENLVIINLLKRGIDVYEPCVDDKTIDLLILIDDIPVTIQVKNHGYMRTNSSIQIRVKKTDADVIAVPYKDRVFYFRNRKKDGSWGISLAIKRPKNNQKTKVRFAEDYEEFPYDDI